MPIDTTAARTFIEANARLLEQLVHEALFGDGTPGAVVRAVLAYQNDDGGFGHGLEPDTRCPASQPLDVEIALERLVTVGAATGGSAAVTLDAAARACDFLAGVADETGAVPVLLPSAAGHPRAAHWEAADHYPPALNPTASLAAHLHALGVAHPWLDRATAYCTSALEQDGAPDDAHTALCVSKFLEHAQAWPGRDQVVSAVVAALPAATMFQMRPDPANYGVTPLDLAPSPSSAARAWFDDDIIAAHLDALEQQQAADGGWPVHWDPPSEASRCEWRAIRTLSALQVLRAYGRLDGVPGSSARAATSAGR